jgi:hypothetical protein
MPVASFEGVPDGPVIALARLILTRVKLNLPCTTRAAAIAIIRGVKPAPSKTTPLNIKPCDPALASICRRCHMPIGFGQACRTFSLSNEADEHITCPKDLDTIYRDAVQQVSRKI